MFLQTFFSSLKGTLKNWILNKLNQEYTMEPFGKSLENSFMALYDTAPVQIHPPGPKTKI